MLYHIFMAVVGSVLLLLGWAALIHLKAGTPAGRAPESPSCHPMGAESAPPTAVCGSCGLSGDCPILGVAQETPAETPASNKPSVQLITSDRSTSHG